MLRREVHLEEHAPIEPRRLAEHLGLTVWSAGDVPGIRASTLDILLRKDPDAWSAVTVHAGAKSVIVLNPTHSEARIASDLSHELAHVILAHEPARVDVSENGHLLLHSYNRPQEDEAAWLSGCLLLPRGALFHIRRQRWADAQAARVYGVSLDMLRYRLSVSAIDRVWNRRAGAEHRSTPRR